jgi:hypothetical protein
MACELEESMMQSINYWPRPSAPIQPEDQFEALRAAFYRRLYGDRVELAELSAQLARTDLDPMPVYYRLHVLGHRVCGAAALFEAAEMAQAAMALEQAALAAAKPNAVQAGAAVRIALDGLMDFLPTSDA